MQLIPSLEVKAPAVHKQRNLKATDKVSPGSADLRQPFEALYFQRVYWVIEGLVWAGNV